MHPLKGTTGTSEVRRRALFVGLAVALYTALTVLMFVQVRHANKGQFFFALDDPYIHLALAGELRHGHYGLNPGEAASPSSSLLWPFLLVPFAAAEWAPYGALALNVFAGLGAAALLGWAVSDWPARFAEKDETLRRALAVVLLVFVGNLVGLTFLGMEHTLQVLLAAAVALGVIRCLEHRAPPWWAVAAAVLGPSVRYESLGLTLAFCIALAGRGQRRFAAYVLSVSVLPLVLFGIFLHHLGLPPLPISVMLKGGLQIEPSGVLHRVLHQGNEQLHGLLLPEHTLLLVLFLSLCGVAWNERDPARRMALTGAALAAALHLAIGRFGWFHRYEVYIVLFSTLLLLHVLSERRRMLLGWFALGLLFCATPYIDAWRTTIAGTGDIYRMQAQMRRFADEYFGGNIAVNDLGLVSYHHRRGEYILDLVGLGSMEAARQADKSPAWMEAIAARHEVGLAMIFRAWFPRTPASWTRLGSICLVNRPVVLPDSCTQFYATDVEDRERLRRAFDQFGKTLPEGAVAVAPGQQAEATR